MTTNANAQGVRYVDLDGTLAHYDGWKAPDVIGDPIPAMMERVKKWLMAGDRVKIFTARFPEHHCYVREWLFRHGLGGLEVTNVKGIDGFEFWDDRAVPVEPNTGRVLLLNPEVDKQIESLRLLVNNAEAHAANSGDMVAMIAKALGAEQGDNVIALAEKVRTERDELGEKLKAYAQTRLLKVKLPTVEEVNDHLIENNFSTTTHIEMGEALRFAESRAVVVVPRPEKQWNGAMDVANPDRDPDSEEHEEIMAEIQGAEE